MRRPRRCAAAVRRLHGDARPRVADYLALTKPRMAVLVLFTVAAGALLAGGVRVDGLALFHVLFGTALVAAGASTLNQLLERHSDARMRRTENRPLPAGRLAAAGGAGVRLSARRRRRGLPGPDAATTGPPRRRPPSPSCCTSASTRL